jgi:uncharacterized protein YbjT (DUF2867 family)
VQGNVTDAAAVDAAIAGQDAVVSALGPKKGDQMADVTTGVRNIIAAMQKHSVRRLVFQSALGVGESLPQSGFLFGKVIMPLFMKPAYTAKAEQEAAIKASNLDWVIVRPSRLTDGPPEQRGRILGPNDKVGMSAKSSRSGVAGFLLAQLTDSRYLRQATGLG